MVPSASLRALRLYVLREGSLHELWDAMLTRRSLFGFLVVAPFAGVAAVKAMADDNIMIYSVDSTARIIQWTPTGDYNGQTWFYEAPGTVEFGKWTPLPRAVRKPGVARFTARDEWPRFDFPA